LPRLYEAIEGDRCSFFKKKKNHRSRFRRIPKICKKDVYNDTIHSNNNCSSIKTNNKNSCVHNTNSKIVATAMATLTSDTKKIEPHIHSPFSSTKISFLVSKLKKIQRKFPGEKAVVFSQWTSMLDLIDLALEEVALKTARLDGTMNREMQETAIDQFQNDSHINIFLISLKAGGVGLNLTMANHLFMVDIWWNPAIEQQAFDRIYRMGQKKKVFIHRFIRKNSVEERILDLQKTKKKWLKIY